MCLFQAWVACEDSAGALIVLTRTAHPGAFVSGRCLGVKVFGLITGPTDHQKKHGRDTMETMFQALKVPAAKAALGVSKRAFTVKDLNLITEVQVDRACPIQPRDVTPPGDSVFCGLDMHVEDLASLATTCLEKELSAYGLELVSTDYGRALRSTKVPCLNKTKLFLNMILSHVGLLPLDF